MDFTLFFRGTAAVLVLATCSTAQAATVSSSTAFVTLSVFYDPTAFTVETYGPTFSPSTLGAGDTNVTELVPDSSATSTISDIPAAVGGAVAVATVEVSHAATVSGGFFNVRDSGEIGFKFTNLTLNPATLSIRVDYVLSVLADVVPPSTGRVLASSTAILNTGESLFPFATNVLSGDYPIDLHDGGYGLFSADSADGPYFQTLDVNPFAPKRVTVIARYNAIHNGDVPSPIPLPASLPLLLGGIGLLGWAKLHRRKAPV